MKLSKQQEAIWLNEELYPESSINNVGGYISNDGDLDVKILSQSIEHVLSNTDVIHQSFDALNKAGNHQYKPTIGFDLEEIDYSLAPDPEKRCLSWMETDITQRIDLQKKPFNFQVLKASNQKHYWYFKVHHVMFDGFSMTLFINTVTECYASLIDNSNNELSTIDYKYTDYIADELKYLQSDEYTSDKNFWLNRLETASENKAFESSFKSNKATSLKAIRKELILPRSKFSRIVRFCKENECTVFHYFIGLIFTLNKGYNNEDIILGLPIFNRRNKKFKSTLGTFVNMLPFSVKFNDDHTFVELLHQVKHELRNCYRHQRYSLIDILNDLDRNGNVYNVSFSYQKNSFNKKLGHSDIRTTYLSSGEQEEDLTIHLLEYYDTEDLILAFDYREDVFEEQVIDGLMQHFDELIENVLENKDCPLNQLEYMSEQEKNQLLGVNGAKKIYPKDKTLIDLFEEQVKQAPDNVAIVFEGKPLTYRALNERSNRLGDYLRRNYAVKPDDFVGVKLDRSEHMLIAILGVLKSGGAYVPIDPNYPEKRIAYMIKDSGCKVLIDEDELSEFEKVQDKYGRENLPKVNTPEDLAYLIYTSGSTGNPKGVMVENGQLCNRILGELALLEVEGTITTCLTTNYVFDVSLLEIFLALFDGGKIVIPTDEVLASPHLLFGLLKTEGVNVLQGTPSFIHNLIEELKGNEDLDLQRLCIGGESLSRSLVNDVRNKLPNAAINNHYGPTETVIDAIVNKNISQFHKNVIGKPLPNQQVYIINQSNKLLPIGTIGEICIGGDGLARGYLNHPELTVEKFVANPFVEGERMYKTGDLGRWMPDGNIEFIGRKDDQVKVRGHRIELGEIQSALKQNELLEDVVVLVKQDEQGEQNIVAYIKSKAHLNASALRNDLNKHLPEYMVPTYFVPIKEVPLTPNGKIDKDALPNPNLSEINTGIAYVAPRNETEERLVKLWQEILGRDNVGVKDNFFELGGHSLKAMRLVSSVLGEFDIKLSLKEVFSQNTIEAQGVLLNKSVKTNHSAIPAIPLSDSYALSSSQNRLWVLSQFEKGNLAYNMPGVFELSGELNRTAFEKTFEHLIARHEVLRTVFKENESGEVRQLVRTVQEQRFTIGYQDLRSSKNIEQRVKEIVQQEITLPFDLEYGPLLRAGLIQIEENRYVFTYVMHHIVSDGWSMEVLLKELMALYNSFAKGGGNPLTPLRIHYKDYAAWQKTQLNSDQLIDHKNYWLNQFKGDLPVLKLPTDHVRPSMKTYKGAVVNRSIDKEQTEKFKALLQQEGGTLFMGVLGLVNALLYKYAGQEDIILGSPIAGRDHVDLEGQIGFYVNTLALRTQFKGENSYKDLLGIVKQVTLGAYEHQMYSFDNLVDELQLKRDTSRTPLFDVMVLLQTSDLDNILSNNDFGGVALSNYEAGEHVVSKFDLSFEFTEQEQGIALSLEYNTDLFDQRTIERLGDHLTNLLSSIVANPSKPIHKLDYLSDQEKHQLLVEFNDTSSGYSKEKTLIELFEDQVKKTPQNVAVIHKNNKLTYEELDVLANKFAHYLVVELGIGYGDRVVVSLDHDHHLMAVLLGVKKAGAIYVPVDSQTPLNRLTFIQKNSGSKVVIDKEVLSQMNSFTFNGPDNKLDRIVGKDDDVEFIIYTSGSTNIPKGILIKRSSVLNRLHWMWKNYPFQENEVGSAKTSIGFVDHIWEFYGPLLKGVPLVFYHKSEVLDVTNFINSLSDNKVSRIVLVPSLLRSMLSYADLCREKLDQLNLWISSGEALKKVELENFYEVLARSNVRLLNIYGSTELTADATFYDTYKDYNRYKTFKLFDDSIEKDVEKLITRLDNTTKITSKPFDKLLESINYSDVSCNVRLTTDDYVNHLNTEVLPNIVNVGSPSYVGHMTGPVPKMFRELSSLVVAFNQNQVKIETSAIATLVEKQVIGIFHNLVYGQGNDFYAQHVQESENALGVVTNGGTMSNLLALSYALNLSLGPKENFRGITEEGLVKALQVYGYSSVVLLGSKWCHYSFSKTLKLLGLGRDAFIELDFEDKTDETIKEEVIAKVNELKQDNALILGLVGVAGSTESGNIEPLKILGEVAEQYGVHFHVDAAFGGSFLLDDDLKEKFNGIQFADSVSICAHKQLYVPIGLSICLFKDPSFALTSENNTHYQARKGSYDLGKYSIEGSRGFMSLLLHAAFHIYGKEGFAEIIRHNYNTAQRFADLVKRNTDFELFCQPELNIVLYRYIPSQLRGKKSLVDDDVVLMNEMNSNIQKEQFKAGDSFVSYTKIKTKANKVRHTLLRTVFMNPYTLMKDLELMLDEQRRIAARIENVSDIKLPVKEGENVSIGKPIENVKVYILDDNLSVLPVGLVGEICVSGDCVSLGYVELDESLEDKFIDNPFVKGERLFRTGDLGRRLPDGNIDFVGRKDDQINIRGYRVELGEIESVLQKNESVDSAVVVANETKNGDKRLVAYVVGKEVLDVAMLRKGLKEQLPDYMVPTHFVQLDQLPLTLSGKIDKKALPNPEDLEPNSSIAYVAPRNEVEEQLVELWEEVLGRKNIGIRDNFFELGGHSLKATQLISRINLNFKVKIKIENIFVEPSIESLATHISFIQNQNNKKHLVEIDL